MGIARQERPGPVHLELPEDIAHEEWEDVPLIPPHPIDYPVAPSAALNRIKPSPTLAKVKAAPELTGKQPDYVGALIDAYNWVWWFVLALALLAAVLAAIWWCLMAYRRRRQRAARR